jgi:hypothetical protein
LPTKPWGQFVHVTKSLCTTIVSAPVLGAGTSPHAASKFAGMVHLAGNGRGGSRAFSYRTHASMLCGISGLPGFARARGIFLR